ncbi:exopolysaccharide biosynthesis polyprenyl glycosylphosphotransferase [Formosa maritima]|uniref:Exopolysaccharide biosynthesis polyprenyl glycosylphosphotransferase n=1 Tax=Formosa maritima TaxID=2592046 RepID=A0A5D0GD39_9FLAO|nr:exopolysaccharide biosynthesis polyprenyl glycosylphosphotransferase [Formosa maritima]TYA56671.1 exopolysaccharide biosynthesis polyprenyl glycosylphosphotransferase [Formosa maritima]
MSKNDIHFNISERKVLLRIVDILSILGMLYLISSLFAFDYFSVTKENWTWVVVLLLYISVFGTIFELYDLQKASKLDKVISNIFLTASFTVLFYLLTPYFTPFLPTNRLQIVYFYLAIILALLIWRFIYVNFITSPRFYKKVLIVGEISNIESIIDAFKNSDPNYKIVGFINCELSQKDSIKFKGIAEYACTELHQVIEKEKISEIIVASYNAETITTEIYNDLILLLERGFPIKEYTQVIEDMTYRVPVQFVGKDFYKYFPFSRSNQNKFYLFYHRLFDTLFSFAGVIVGLCILPFILLGNLIANRGPLFYFQDRVGKNGKVFSIIKFRTMIIDAEKQGAVWAEKDDIRVTTFGRFLRRSRLDEFPQFLNILKGDMSLIGPRPERPYFVKELSQVIPFYETRHIIKPGLTGWAQVKVRYGSTVEDSLLKLQYDLYYIKHRSFFLDANVIVKTLSTMVFYRGQ